MKRRDFEKERNFYTALAEMVRDCAARSGSGAIIVPGGRTPVPLYQRLLKGGLESSDGFRVILSDERYCDVASQDSNQGAVLPLLKRSGLSLDKVIVPDTTLSVETAASRYDGQLSAFIGNGGVLSTAILGVGSDGHTAGIFDENELGSGQFAAVTKRTDGLLGITCTPQFCKMAERIIFIVRGAEKQNIVDAVLENAQASVAGRIAADHPNAEIWFCLE